MIDTPGRQMIVQLRRDRLIVADVQTIEKTRAEFEIRHCILLPTFLDSGLARSLLAALDQTSFSEHLHHGIGTELVARPTLAAGALELLANDPQLFATIRALTGCGPIGCFQGRVYRMVPGSGHYDSWHSDNGEDRLIAMSINLSPESYAGGILQIREKASPRPLHEAANTGFGDAIVFRIAATLTHRVTNVEGRLAKTAYAGWFRSQPMYRELLAERQARLK